LNLDEQFESINKTAPIREELLLAGVTTTRRWQQETKPREETTKTALFLGGDNEDGTVPCSPALEDGDLNDKEEDQMDKTMQTVFSVLLPYPTSPSLRCLLDDPFKVALDHVAMQQRMSLSCPGCS
jgi:hypothetical protein